MQNQKIMTVLHQRFQSLCEIGVLLAGLASVAGFLGYWHWAADLVSHFRVQYFIGGAFCAVVFILCKRWRWGIAAFLLAGVNAAVLLPELIGKPVDLLSGAQLKVVSYNLYTGNPNKPEVVQWLAETDADVLFLMETNHEWWLALEPLRGKYSHHSMDLREDNFGMVALSRIPWQELNSMDLPQQLPGFHAIFLLEQEIKFHLIGLHPLPPMGSTRAAMRDEYLEAAADKIQRLSGPLLVVGDLNTTPWAPSFKRFTRSAGLERRSGGIRPTWHAFGGLAGIPIDHVLTSNGAHILLHASGPRMGSDHYPQIITLQIQ